jgi:hypothetical protein
LVDKFLAQFSANLFTYPQSKNVLKVKEDKNGRKINLKPNHFLRDGTSEGEQGKESREAGEREY